MTDKKPAPDFSDVEMRRSKASRRRMSTGRRFAYAIGMPLLRSILYMLNSSYRVQKIIGSDIADRIVADTSQAYVPCYWHQQHVVCAYLIRNWFRRGFRAAYIVSPSVDGEIVSRIVKSWGGDVIRGSAADTGALVLRDSQKLMKNGVSIVATSDGPLGPAFEFKAGTVLMASIGGAPMVPIAYAADRVWNMNTWDHFIIPKPFARVVIAVGEPVEVPRRASKEDMEAIRVRMESGINGLIQECKDKLNSG